MTHRNEIRVIFFHSSGPFAKKRQPWLALYIFYMAEEEGFEPPRRLPDLPHFECGPFSLLGTPPCFTALFKKVFHDLTTFITKDPRC